VCDNVKVLKADFSGRFLWI